MVPQRIICSFPYNLHCCAYRASMALSKSSTCTISFFARHLWRNYTKSSFLLFPFFLLISEMSFCPIPLRSQDFLTLGGAIVAEDSLPIYSANSLKSDIVRVLNKGDHIWIQVEITGFDDKWCLICEEGKNETLGFVFCKALEYIRDDSIRSDSPTARTNQPRPVEETTKTLPSEPSGRVAVSQAYLGSLLQAIWKEDISSVKELLENGADPNARTKLGAAPLHIAAKKESEIIRLLIAYGADPNARDENGLTPLMAAASAGQVHNVKLLLTAGADLNGRDEQGSTALMRTVIQGSPNGVEVLLENGAEINAKSTEGRTALWLSRQILASTQKSLANAYRKNSEELIKELRIKLANHEEVFRILQSSGGKE